MKKIHKILYPFQKKAVEFCMGDGHKGMFITFGGGKTLSSLATAQKWLGRKNTKIVIVCQPTKVLDWIEDCKEWFDCEVFTLYKKDKKQTDKIFAKLGSSYIVIIPQTTLWRREIPDKLFDTIWIYDEITTAKSRQSSIGKWMASNADRMRKLIVLTGDVIPQGYKDLYNILVILGYKIKYKDFVEWFCYTKEIKPPGLNFGIQKITGYKNVEELNNIIDYVGFVYDAEKDLDLPQEVVSVINIDMDLKTYKKVKKDKVYQEVQMDSPMKLMTSLRQFTSGYVENVRLDKQYKLDALRDLVEVSGKDFLIFYNFNEELYMMKELFESLNIKVFEINGHKHDDIKEVKAYKGQKVVLGQYASASIGLNLQSFNHCIFYSPPLTAEFFKQGFGRIKRIGSVGTHVFYYEFITKGSIEEKIYQSLKQSKDYSLSVFIESENYYD